ncbi:MAG: 3-dehydroquinate synthase [Robiginitomaculum sp.]
MESVRVDLGPRSYDIHIGAGVLTNAGKYIAPLLTNKRVAIITDETVADLHLETLTGALTDSAIGSQAFILPAGEASKSYGALQSLLDDLLDAGYERGDYIIALGGGVIGDLAGFAASILKRGCGFIQIPTTLLAQVDSSVGGKTAINTRHGKNLIGAFYQPALVLVDTDVLSTLAERQMRAGYAEILKYGLLGDAEFFNWLEGNSAKVLDKDRAALSYAIAKSCRAKAAIVAADEREHGRRALLNLGHTFGHSLEAQAGYGGALLHGEAVATGMVMAFDYCAQNKICSEDDAARVRAHLRQCGLKTFAELAANIRSDADTHMVNMGQDKKNSGGEITLILARAIGDSYVEKTINTNMLREFLNTQIKKANG